MDTDKLTSNLLSANPDSNPTSDFALELYRTVDFWAKVEKLMKWCRRTDPAAWKEAVAEAKAKREANFNKWGGSENKVTDGMTHHGDMRDLVVVPEPVKMLIDRFWEEDMSKKNVYREFAKKYPMLRRCEVI